MRKWTIRKLRGCVFPFCIHISFCHVSLWFFSLSKKKYYPPFNTQCEFTISLTSSTLIHFHVYVMPRDAVSKNVCTQTFKQLHAHRSIHKKKIVSSIHTYTCAHPRTATIRFPTCTFIVSRMKDVIGLKPYTVLLHSNVLFCTMKLSFRCLNK